MSDRTDLNDWQTKQIERNPRESTDSEGSHLACEGGNLVGDATPSRNFSAVWSRRLP